MKRIVIIILSILLFMPFVMHAQKEIEMKKNEFGVGVFFTPMILPTEDGNLQFSDPLNFNVGFLYKRSLYMSVGFSAEAEDKTSIYSLNEFWFSKRLPLALSTAVNYEFQSKELYLNLGVDVLLRQSPPITLLFMVGSSVNEFKPFPSVTLMVPYEFWQKKW